MALDTYANLQTSLATWSKRSDMTALWPDIIVLAEARINRELRVRNMLTRATMTIVAEFTNAPADFVGIRTMRVTGVNPYTVLTTLTPEQMADYAAGTPSGNPQAVAVVGSQLWVQPVQTAAISVELTYYATVPALSNSNTTNCLLATFPDVYLWGGLLEFAIYTEDDPQTQKYAGLFEAALSDIRSADQRDSYGTTLAPSPSIQPA